VQCGANTRFSQEDLRFACPVELEGPRFQYRIVTVNLTMPRHCIEYRRNSFQIFTRQGPHTRLQPILLNATRVTAQGAMVSDPGIIGYREGEQVVPEFQGIDIKRKLSQHYIRSCVC